MKILLTGSAGFIGSMLSLRLLDRGDEVEAFQTQMLYESENNSIENVVDYAKNLIEFHKVPKKERVKKVIELLTGKSGSDSL